MPQVIRNRAARNLLDELSAHTSGSGLTRNWLRSQINAIVVEELQNVRADIIADVKRSRHYHGADSGIPENAVLTARKLLAQIDRRIAGNLE